MTTSSATPRPGRRTLVKGAAWSVPAIAVATQAHAQGASVIQCLTVAFSGTSCKCPGQGQNDFSYNLSVCFTNTCPVGTAPITVNVVRLVSNSGVVLCPSAAEQLVIEPGQTACTTPQWYFSQNSANFIDVVYRIGDGPELEHAWTGSCIATRLRHTAWAGILRLRPGILRSLS